MSKETWEQKDARQRAELTRFCEQLAPYLNATIQPEEDGGWRGKLLVERKDQFAVHVYRNHDERMVVRACRFDVERNAWRGALYRKGHDVYRRTFSPDRPACDIAREVQRYVIAPSRKALAENTADQRERLAHIASVNQQVEAVQRLALERGTLADEFNKNNPLIRSLSISPVRKEDEPRWLSSCATAIISDTDIKLELYRIPHALAHEILKLYIDRMAPRSAVEQAESLLASLEEVA